MTKIGFVLGTRPEIIKLYPCIKYCSKYNIDYFVVNTDQHYDKNMRDVFFEELGLVTPKYGLDIGSASHPRMLAKMLPAIEDVLLKEKPDVVVVQGDTNTVLAGCLVANKMGIKVAHIEAGLRSYDRSMPEEYNRIVVDHCADYLFAPTQKQADILLAEQVPKDSVFVVGNTIVDAVKDISDTDDVPAPKKPLVLLTAHRPSNTDSKKNLEGILSAIQAICEEQGWECIFPVHPRLSSRVPFIKSFKNVRVVEPMKYSDLLKHIKMAQVVFTDSGGIQEEACILEKLCVILRTNTERPETIEVGGAVVLDEVSEQDIIAKFNQLKNKKVGWYNPFGEGDAGERIIKILMEKNA
jgi:UDP-N-acetylglucosamine 2-epimerase (non-hydrolysing)